MPPSHARSAQSEAGSDHRTRLSKWGLNSFRQRAIVLGFLISTVLLSFLFAVAYRSNKEFVRWNNLAIHTREVLRGLDSYGTAVKNAQVAALDYYAKGSDVQVKVFTGAETQGRSELEHVRRLIADNPVQQRNLNDLMPLAEAGFGLLGKVIQLHRDGISGTDGLKPINEESKKISPQLSNAYKKMIAEENRLLDLGTQEAAGYARKAKWLQVCGGALAILLMIVTFGMFLRENSFRANAEQQLEQMNLQLEERIAQRTTQLQGALTQVRKENEERLAAETAVTKLNTELEERVRRRTAELEASNRELEAFCYSVSHDLRAPLRGIDGFSAALLDEHGDRLDDEGRGHLQRVRLATARMSALIDGLLNLSRITRAEMRWEPVNLSEMAQAVASEVRSADPRRKAEFVIASDLQAKGDPQLIQLVLQNLLSNSWKFTSRRECARIELGRTSANGKSAFFVADNGAGFDPAYAGRLFGAFQRLHGDAEFPGTGVGLATVQRIVQRHGGEIWADSSVDHGATFYFTL